MVSPLLQRFSMVLPTTMLQTGHLIASPTPPKSGDSQKLRCIARGNHPTSFKSPRKGKPHRLGKRVQVVGERENQFSPVFRRRCPKIHSCSSSLSFPPSGDINRCAALSLSLSLVSAGVDAGGNYQRNVRGVPTNNVSSWIEDGTRLALKVRMTVEMTSFGPKDLNLALYRGR